MRSNGAIAVLFALGAVVTGCSDDEDALTEEEFVEQGNAICEAGNERLNAAFEDAFADLGPDEQPDADEVTALIEDVLIPSVQEQVDDLGELEPPDDLSADVEQMLDDAQGALDRLEEQVQDDPEAFLEQEEDPFADANAQANEIGLTACADDA
ncbi:MAG: hypothetical protein ACRDYW_08425 [Acidimicrobiales bacterium]